MFSPYQTMNNYQPYQQNMYQQQMQRQEIAKVNGENGARAYQLAPNSSALLLDEVNPIVYLKVTDSGGYPSITAYSITPYKQEPMVDIKTLEERITRLESMFDESDTTSTRNGKTE